MESARPTRTNWRQENFVTVTGADGSDDDSLEREFAKTERTVLNQIRDITPTGISTSQKRALDLLAAIHLVRSQSFVAMHRIVVDGYFDRSVPEFLADPELRVRFLATYGRPPVAGELEGLVADVAEHIRTGPDLTANGMRHGTAGLPELLGRFPVQLVRSPEELPGFVLADHPVIHADPQHGRYGFASRLAVGDADLILVPIHRRLLACYTRERLPHFTLQTKRGLRTINAALVRNAISEVACHPDDSLDTSQLIRSIDRYPVSGLSDGTLR